jgi:DNA-binding transcriptional ArsR family regulator
MARRKKKPKNQTSERIIRLLEFEPTVSGSAMSRALGISRQAVGQHLARLARKGLLPARESRNRSCWACGKRIRNTSTSGVCRGCHDAAYAYEFRCGQCGEVVVLFGRAASTRRRNQNRVMRARARAAMEDGNSKAQQDGNSTALAYLQFCGRGCAMAHRMRQYWELRREAESAMLGGAAQQGEEVTTDAAGQAW